MSTLSKTLLFVALAIVFLSACSTPVTPAAPAADPTATPSPVVQPTSMAGTSQAESTFSSMGFGRYPWGVALAGENKVCFVDLRINPRSCDGSTLQVTAKTTLLIVTNNEVLTWLKINDVVTLKFERDTTYDFYGLADRNFMFEGEWISTMFMWSDTTKTYPVLLLPRKDNDYDIFIDLADGVVYYFPADAKIFDVVVTNPTPGYLFCRMGETCVFTP